MLKSQFDAKRNLTSYLRQFFQCVRSAHLRVSNTVKVLEAPPTAIKFSVHVKAYRGSEDGYRSTMSFLDAHTMDVLSFESTKNHQPFDTTTALSLSIVPETDLIVFCDSNNIAFRKKRNLCGMLNYKELSNQSLLVVVTNSFVKETRRGTVHRTEM
jgi:hypothetical protein